MRNSDEDGNVQKSSMPTQGERNIWKFYEWAVVLAPIALMLTHWYIFYVFSQNTHEVLSYPDANEICIAWIYSALFLYMPLMILPASYFFRWCNLFRIPFVYFLFINVERWYYGSWFCTNEMIDTHYILIYCIIVVYVFELTEIALRNYKRIFGFFKRVYGFLKKWVINIFGKTPEEKEEDKMFDEVCKWFEEDRKNGKFRCCKSYKNDEEGEIC